MITFDSERLGKLLEELEPKRRMQAVKGGFRKTAEMVRKQAVSNLRASGLKSKGDQKGLEKGIRKVLYKKTAGFRVTVGTKSASRKTGKGEAGFHTNRRGQKKPVVLWAEGGTKDRNTKTSAKFGRMLNFRKKKGHYTGRMKEYGFMEKTEAQVKEKVTEELRKQMEENITRIAKKYGCS